MELSVDSERPKAGLVPFLATAGVCLAVFAWMLTFGTFEFRVADTFGNFYDHQAAAWLEGKWDVPEAALSGEAFIVDGKTYGYFGPTPALMRLPLVALGVGFGEMTRLFMLLDYAACLLAAWALLQLAFRWHSANASPPRWIGVLFIATVGLGSTLFFLGSRAYVYHEAILCGAAFALWGTYCALRYLETPGSHWCWVSLVCGVLAVQARAPIGLFALCVLGTAAVVIAVSDWRAGGVRALRREFAVGVACAAGVLSFNGVSYLKFGTIEGCPLRYNVQYTPEKLAVIEHRNFHWSNLRFNADAYLFRPSFSLKSEFPYVFREYIDRRQYPESRLAYRDQTLAMPWAMPGLFFFATAGSIVAFAMSRRSREPLTVLWLAAAPAAMAMLAAVAVTQRYEADFCPFLIAAAAFGLAAFPSLPVFMRRTAAIASGILTVAGILVGFALTLHHQREIVWGVPEDVREDYAAFRQRVDAWLRGASAP